MGIRDRIKRLEQAARGDMVSIPQQDGSVKRFPQSELLPAFVNSLERGRGEAVEPHPLCIACDNSSDPIFRNSAYSTQYIIDEDGNLHDPANYPVPDLSD